MGPRLNLGKRSLLGTVLVLSLALPAMSARALPALKFDGGWTASTDGLVNAFVVDETGDAEPAGVVGDTYSRANDQGNFRVRTGFLPSKLGFTFGAPEWQGLKVASRVALYPQINNGGSRTSITPNIDFREFYFTVDGKFGQVLFGRALNLFQQQNILSDMSLFGVGVPSAAFAGGPTLGHVGFGYLYPAFDAQLRYTTPTMSGLKVAVAVTDPSNIGAANVTPTPTLEAEATFSTKSGAAAFRAWLGGLYQSAKLATGATWTDVTATGVHAGVGAGFSGLDVHVSGFTGKGLGTATQLDGADALDGADKERTTSGVFAQATYLVAGKTKLGASYGRTMAKQTDAEKAASSPVLDNRQAITAGVYHDMTSWMKLVLEYTNAKLTWFEPAGATEVPTQTSNIVGAGMVVSW